MRAFAQAMLPPLIRIAEIVTAMLLFVMMMLTFADVIGRYVFTAPIFGAAEMIQFLLAMTIFGGLCLINARDEHITVELFEARLDRYIPRLRRDHRAAVLRRCDGDHRLRAVQIRPRCPAIGTKTVVLEWPFAVVAFTVAGLSVVSLVAAGARADAAAAAHQPDDLGGGL